MGLVNGALDGVLLVPVAGESGAKLRLGSARRWAAIRDEVHERFGWWPDVTSAGDGYRDEARQRLLFSRNYTTERTGHGPAKKWGPNTFWRRTSQTPSAAVPGKSNHGLGTTVDVVNVGHYRQFRPTTVRYDQFADVAVRHSFSNAEGRSIGEPWHWSDTSDPDDGILIPLVSEADMPLNQADLEAIDRLIIGRVTTVVDQLLTQHQGNGVLTQIDKEAVDKLIIDRLAQGLGPLSQAVGALQASLAAPPPRRPRR